MRKVSRKGKTHIKNKKNKKNEKYSGHTTKVWADPPPLTLLVQNHFVLQFLLSLGNAWIKSQ